MIYSSLKEQGNPRLADVAVRYKYIDILDIVSVCLFSNLLENSRTMDKILAVKTFLIGYAVAVFLTNTNRLMESIGFYFECLVLLNQLSVSKPSSVMTLIEHVIRQKFMRGVLLLEERGLKFYDLGQIKESISCLKKALCIYEKAGPRFKEAWCHCHLGRSLHIECQYERAMEHYQKALDVSGLSRHEKQELEGRVYNNIGEVYNVRGNYEKARHYYEKAFRINKEIGNEIHQAIYYNNMGVMNHNYLGNLEVALDFHEKALEIRKRLGYRKAEGTSYNNIGGVYEARGDYKKALEYYEKSLELSVDIEDRVLEASNLYFIGKVSMILGQLQKAMEYLERALELKSDTGVKKAGNLTDLGNLYMYFGDYDKASQYHQQAIKLCEELGDREIMGRCHQNASLLPRYLGEYEKVKSHLEKAVDIYEKNGNKVDLAMASVDISYSYISAGQHQKACEYLQKALKVSKETGHIQIKTSVLTGFSVLNFYLGKYEQAIGHAKDALQIAKKVGQKEIEVSCYVLLGNAYFAQGHNEKAIQYQSKALECRKEIGMKDQSQVYLQYILGQLYSSQGNFSRACENFHQSIKIHQRTRSSLKDETDKISLDGTNCPCYKSLSWLLLRERNFNQALFTLELGRSRALVDLMLKRYEIKRNLVQNELTPNALESFLKERKKNFLFIATFGMKSFALWFVDTTGRVKFKQVNADLETELSKESSATEEHGMDTSSSTLDDLQCEDRSLASLYENDVLASREQKLKPNKGSVKMQVKQIGSKSCISLSYLVKSYSALIAPIFDLIDSPEIIISPEPSFFLTPFASLKDENGKYLSETVRVRLIPSLTTLKLIHDSAASYHSQSGALIVGDPAVGPVEINGSVKTLDPLPKAREEAQMVSRLVGVRCLIGEEATKEEVLKRIQEVSLVHIAAHGDETTGEIALAPNRSVVGVPKIGDVLLTMNDIAQVGIRAKLVVLSCCHSARGKTLIAEGIVGIARAFLGSGARSVLMSLWAVDDEATKAFMNIFYKFLIREKLSASESLDLTMTKMRESVRYSDRKHWAPFVLLGDNVTLTF